MNQKCAWCENPAILSHIIPASITRTIKKQRTRFALRALQSPNLKIQDTQKVRLLCAEHDRFFSAEENLFVKSVFRPLNKQGRVFEYDEWLTIFASFLAWKRLKTGLPQMSNLSAAEFEVCRIRLAELERYLLNKDPSLANFPHHLLLTGLIQDGLLTEWQRKLLSEIYESSIIKIPEFGLFVWTTIPNCMIISPLQQTDLDLGRNTKIVYGKSKLSESQMIPGELLYAWLRSAALEVSNANQQTSERQRARRLIQTIKVNHGNLQNRCSDGN